MKEEFNKYKHIEKTSSELETDRIFSDMYARFWKEAGYEIIYNLAVVNQLKAIAQALDKYQHLDRDDILKLISTYKNSTGVSDLVKMILEEFDYKEN